MRRWTFNRALKEARALGFQLWRGTLRRCDGYSARSDDGRLHVVGSTLIEIVARMREARRRYPQA